jgi:D-alanyl-lipoteichoic acid acyltransferase DltB (MBOAT superfamily)
VLDERKMYTGILFVLSGIFKKVVLADQMAPLINPIWNAPAQYDSLSLILATVGFSIQIYCDFSGYTDIARGAAALIGFDIPENFTDPFFSTSFRDLWQKWHITLSTWIRDYLYIPLGGSRSGPVRSELNTVIAMSLAGLWHGTTYNYFLWGFLHGVLLVAERLVMGKRKLQSHVAKVIGYTVTMTGWLIGAVFFRSYDMTSASAFFKGIFSLSGERVDKVGTIVLIVVVAMIFQFFRVRSERFQAMVNRRPRTVVFTLTLLLFFVLTGLEIQSEQFIYFQF